MAKKTKKGQDKHERRREKALRKAQAIFDDDNADNNEQQEDPILKPSETSSKPQTSLISLPQELFEAIFLQLDQASLLTTAQRVCRLWFELIQTSPGIQQHLFYLPIAPTAHNCSRPKENPLMRHLLGPLCFQHLPLLKGENYHHDPPPYAPILDPRLYSLQDMKETLSTLPMADVRDQRRLSEAFLRQGASWRRMLPSQPPPSEILHFFDPYGGRVALTAENAERCFRHRLRACEGQSCGEIGDGGDVDGHESVFRLGEIYDMLYYILWGGDIPYGRSTAVSAGLLPPRALNMMTRTTPGVNAQEHGPKTAVVRWALFSALSCGRYDPGFVFRRQKPSAIHTEFSRYWFHQRRYGADFDYQRARRSSMGRFKCEDYDEERTKRIVRLQSEKDGLVS